MKYEVWPLSKPEPEALIYWVNCERKEVLGYYLGHGKFVDGRGAYNGYYVKYWRLAPEHDRVLVSWLPNHQLDEVRVKRKYVKKDKSEPKPVKTGKRGRPKKNKS